VLFGVGVVPQILVVILVIVVVVAVTVQAGVQGIQGDYIRNARALGANGAQLLSSVYVPGVSIWVISSARLTVGMAFQAAVVAEFFGSANGLGYLIDDGLQTFNAPQIYAAVIVTAVLALLVDFGLGFVERRYSRWLPGGRNGS
jgi:NitT/TauT family transport system permease protein